MSAHMILINVGHAIETLRTAQDQARGAAADRQEEPFACALILLTALHMVYLADRRFTAETRADLGDMAAAGAAVAVAALNGHSREARH